VDSSGKLLPHLTQYNITHLTVRAQQRNIVRTPRCPRLRCALPDVRFGNLFAS
jgi:hypothetical protein